MIAQLSGKIVHKSPTTSVVDCGGVGYEVLHTPFTAEKILGEVALFFIHTHMREDALQLFGFASLEERSLFRELLKVNGIGPKLALSILSGLPYEEVLQAITRRDQTRLQKIPGVGKKTAERLLLELSDKLKNLPERSTKGAPLLLDKDFELESVLLHLGYQKTEIQRAVKTLKTRLESFEESSLEHLVKATLKELTQVKSV